jgi:SAM-dependent methyltransferase
MTVTLPQIIDWTVTEDAEAYVQSHRIRLLRTLECVPEGGPGKALLDMGSYLQMAPVCKFIGGYPDVYACYLGTGTRNANIMSREGKEFQSRMDFFDAEKDTFPYQDAQFDCVLCCEVLSYMQCDPMWMMYEINRTMKVGGTLILSVPNACSIKAVWKVLNGFHPGFFSNYIISSEPRLAREYSPGELKDLAEASGYQVTEVKGCNYALDFTETDRHLIDHLRANSFPEIIREECLITAARKMTAPQSRYPKWLYY